MRVWVLACVRRCTYMFVCTRVHACIRVRTYVRWVGVRHLSRAIHTVYIHIAP